jgi:hypothetical protein
MRPLVVLVALLGLVLDCRSDGVTATREPLEQVVRLAPASPTGGGTLRITSTIYNRGPTTVDLSTRTCGLDTNGDLALSGSLLMCAAYSRQVTLEPSDSVSAFDARVVSSPPGHYTLRVRQALDPERWVELPVVIQ